MMSVSPGWLRGWLPPACPAFWFWGWLPAIFCHWLSTIFMLFTRLYALSSPTLPSIRSYFSFCLAWLTKFSACQRCIPIFRSIPYPSFFQPR